MNEIIPSKRELERLLAERRTDQGVADYLGCSRSAVCEGRRRYGIPSRQPRKRYDAEIPWAVPFDINGQRINMHHDLRMLRLRGKRAAGQPLSDGQARWLASWENEMTALGQVVNYTDDLGVHRVPRLPSDIGFSRRPDVGDL